MNSSKSRGALVAVEDPLDGVYRRDFAFDRPSATPDSYAIYDPLLDESVVNDSSSEKEPLAQANHPNESVQDDLTSPSRETLFEATIVQHLTRPGNLDYLIEQDKNFWDKTCDLARRVTLSNAKGYARNWRARTGGQKQHRKLQAREARRKDMDTLDERQTPVPATKLHPSSAAASRARPGKGVPSSTEKHQETEEDRVKRDARLYDSWIRGTNYHGLREPI